MNYIPTSAASQINEWWENSTQLVFVWDSSTYDCLITNNSQPFQSLNKPYNNNWHGNVIVEEI